VPRPHDRLTIKTDNVLRSARLAADQSGGAAALWLKADDAQALHDKLAAPGSGSSPPRRRAVRPAVDPEGFLITVHDLA